MNVVPRVHMNTYEHMNAVPLLGLTPSGLFMGLCST